MNSKPLPLPQPQPQQSQKCPRCDSLNTKFCYYNNYSLSQPRYFCKACRRYWTQGGTLRNVRVGGGSRKPKRRKGSASSTSSSSADTSSAPSLLQPTQEAEVLKDPSAASSASAAATTAAIPSISSFYEGGACGGDGGYLSSLAAIQSLNPSRPFNQMSLLSGFGAPSLGSSIRPSQPFYQMGVIRDKEEETVYEGDQVLIQSTTVNSASASTHHDWTESFINNVNHRGSDASLWSTTMSIVSSSGNSQSHNDTVGGSFSLIPNHQWPDLPEYDPPP